MAYDAALKEGRASHRSSHGSGIQYHPSSSYLHFGSCQYAASFNGIQQPDLDCKYCRSPTRHACYVEVTGCWRLCYKRSISLGVRITYHWTEKSGSLPLQLLLHQLPIVACPFCYHNSWCRSAVEQSGSPLMPEASQKFLQAIKHLIGDIFTV